MEIISASSMSCATISKKQRRQGQKLVRVKALAAIQVLTRIRRLSSVSGAGALQTSSMLDP
jgi:hypothetical protein